MPDKLSRAKHTHGPDAPHNEQADAETLVVSLTEAETEPDTEAETSPWTDADVVDEAEAENQGQGAAPVRTDDASIGASTTLISVCTIISRVTGFIRTWAMAFALGSTMLSSAYQVANNLPNMLYELVIGGMLVTAFLPVYMSVKMQRGEKAGNEYASNLLTLIVIALGIISVICIALPGQIMYTQSFLSNQEDMTTATFFFRIFAIELVFYGLSSLLSGLLNANRDYLWSSIAPVANNVVVIASFIVFPFIEPYNYELALYIIAVGKPVAVFVQFAMQWPALKSNGIRLRWHVDLKDPALRDTLRIGLPTVFVMLCSFVVVSVQNAAAYYYTETGPSIIAYSRLWYTFPYSFLAVPITTAMFTELSDMFARDDIEGMKQGIISGTNQIIFLMVPFTFFLILYAQPLVTLYHAGAFTMDEVGGIARYLAALALSLPIYGVNTYLQKIFSSIRCMGVFSLINFFTSALQSGLIIWAALSRAVPIESIALTSVAFYLIGDVAMFVYLVKRYGSFDFRSTLRSAVVGTILGFLGTVTGGIVLWLLTFFIAPIGGSIFLALVYVIIAGLVSLITTFGLAIRMKVPEVSYFNYALDKLLGKLRRSP